MARMGVEAGLLFEELPDLLTVEEAGRFLRIGRGVAYELAREFVATEGRAGLPVIRLGRRLLVPKRQLGLLIAGELVYRPAAPSPVPAPRSRSRQPRVVAQQQLIEGV